MPDRAWEVSECRHCRNGIYRHSPDEPWRHAGTAVTFCAASTVAEPPEKCGACAEDDCNRCLRVYDDAIPCECNHSALLRPSANVGGDQ